MIARSPHRRSNVADSEPRLADKLDADLWISPTIGPGATGRIDGFRLFVARAAVLVGFVALWQIGSGRFVNADYVSRPSAILARLGQWVSSGFIWPHLRTTAYEALAGYLLGAALGLIVGYALGIAPVLARATAPLVTGLYAIPKVTLAPLFVLYFGIYEPSKIALTSVIVFFLIFYSTLNGVRDVDPDLIESVRILGARKWQALRLVVVPATAEWLFTGLTIALPYAVVGAVAGEIVISSKGLGFLIRDSADNFNMTSTFAALVVLMIMTTILSECVKYLRGRVAAARR